MSWQGESLPKTNSVSDNKTGIRQVNMSKIFDIRFLKMTTLFCWLAEAETCIANGQDLQPITAHIAMFPEAHTCLVFHFSNAESVTL